MRARPQEVKVALLRAADGVHRRMAAILAPRRLTTQQYNVLRILRGAGAPLPTLEVAARMIERAPGITRLLDGLEGRGWVARDRGTRDRRAVLCRITPAGLRLLAELDAPVAESDRVAVQGLSDEESEALLQLLARLI